MEDPDEPLAGLEFRVEEAMALLRRTPAALRSLLAGLPERWVHASEGPDTFSPYEVVGHLVHGERTDWISRLRLILEEGEETPFEPFDRFAHRSWVGPWRAYLPVLEEGEGRRETGGGGRG